MSNDNRISSLHFTDILPSILIVVKRVIWFAVAFFEGGIMDCLDHWRIGYHNSFPATKYPTEMEKNHIIHITHQ